jgi:hypothetical protein
MTDHYVYAYFDPYNGVPVYLGAGSGPRWKQHLSGSHNHRLRQLIADHGGAVPHAKLLTGLTMAEAHFNESALIAAIGMAPDGPLFNLNVGGVAGTMHPSVIARSKATWRARREARWQRVLELHASGSSVTEIAAATRYGKPYVRKIIAKTIGARAA